MKERKVDLQIPPGLVTVSYPITESVHVTDFLLGIEGKFFATRGVMMVMLRYAVVLVVIVAGIGCKGEGGGSGGKEVDVQKVMQEAADKEKKMYEGVQKGIEGMEKNLQQPAEKK
jgi:hypothetical protein